MLKLIFSKQSVNLLQKNSFHVSRALFKRKQITTESVVIVDKRTEKTLQSQINHDLGLKQFLGQVYSIAGAGIATTFGTSALLITTAPHFVEQNALGFILGGFACGIAGCFGMDKSTFTINEEKTKSINSPARNLSFCAIVGGASIMLTPFVHEIQSISPTIWPTAIVLSVATSGAATLWARSRPAGSLLGWQGPLYGGLIGLVGTGLAAVVANIFFPGSGIAQFLHSIDVYGGIVLFTGMTAYQTHLAVDMYQKGQPDHLGCAVSVYLDFLNLLIRIAEAMAQSKRNNN